MSELERAARQALDALENEWFWPTPRFAIDAIDALRAALKQAEPVAWVGLTDKDRLDIYGQATTDEIDYYARAIEAALKEKNAKQAEPAAESHKRAINADNDQSMSGNPSF